MILLNTARALDSNLLFFRVQLYNAAVKCRIPIVDMAVEQGKRIVM